MFNATVIITFRKWGVFDWIHTYKPTWLKWYPECEFCYGFQLALIETFFAFFFAPSLQMLIVPFCAASLTYKLTS